jgi:hypothetical protein
MQWIGSDGELMNLHHRRCVFWPLISITAIAAFAPYYWDTLFRYEIVLSFKGHVTLMLGWTGLALCAIRMGRLAKMNPHWVWLFLPIVAWPVARTLLVFASWKLRGFGP